MDNSSKYTAFGIEWISADNRVAVSDISLDEAKVQALVDLCNELELDPIHLQDVVEDFVFDLDRCR